MITYAVCKDGNGLTERLQLLLVIVIISIVPYFTDKGEHTLLCLSNKNENILKSQK